MNVPVTRLKRKPSPSYKKNMPHIGSQLVADMERITLDRIESEGLQNARLNHTSIIKGKSIKRLREQSVGHGDRALVIAAGPSIKRTNVAEQVLNNKFNGAIIATESSMLYCLRNNIIPDLVVTIDPHATRIVRWFGDPNLTTKDLQMDDYFSRQDLDSSFKNELKVNKEILQLLNKHGKHMKIALSSSSSPKVVQRAKESGMDIYWWNPMYDDPAVLGSTTRQLFDLNKLPCLNAGGNVGSACWMMAHAVLNKKHIAVTGMDFGYYAETPYENTQYYKEAVELVGKDHLDSLYFDIFNPHLNKWFYTDPAYMWYQNCLLSMAADADCKTYNCTEGGILFGDSIQFIPLHSFLTRS